MLPWFQGQVVNTWAFLEISTMPTVVFYQCHPKFHVHITIHKTSTHSLRISKLLFITALVKIPSLCLKENSIKTLHFKLLSSKTIRWGKHRICALILEGKNTKAENRKPGLKPSTLSAACQTLNEPMHSFFLASLWQFCVQTITLALPSERLL